MPRLAEHLRAMPDRPPTARQILMMLIETSDVEVSIDGRVTVTFEPDENVLDALMCFDADHLEDEHLAEGKAA